MLAIENMALNKVKYCQQLGIEIEDSWWPCHHLPEEILSDCGSLMSKDSSNIGNLDVAIENTGSGRADRKPVIESAFDRLNDELIHDLPGAVLKKTTSDKDLPGPEDPRLEACLDIHQVEQLIVHYILDYNRYAELEEYPMTDDMFADRVLPVPNYLWKWGMKYRSGKPAELPQDLVRLNLLPRATASVTEDGIIFKGLRYTCNRAQTENWISKVKYEGKGWRVNIIYDPRNLDTIYIRHDKGRRIGQEDKDYLEPCWRIVGDGISTHLDIGELEYQRGVGDEIHSQLESPRPQTKADLNAKIKGIVKEAKAKTKAALGTLGQNTIDIRGRKQRARTMEDQTAETLGVLGAFTPPDTEPAIEETAYIPAENNADYELSLAYIPE